MENYMQIQPISSTNSFQGKFQVNPLFNKFKEELVPEQKEILGNLIKKAEKEQDGRIFKFDKFVNPSEAGGAEVGIFEHRTLIDKTGWIPLFTSTREKAFECFEQMNNMYNTQLAKLNKYKG